VKIVSLLPSATEIVYALGLGDDLAGVTYECDYPAEAREKPVVSDTALPVDRPLTSSEIEEEVRSRMEQKTPIYVLDKELIQRTQPDLILAQDLCRVCAVPSGQVEDALAELGCESEVLSLDPTNLAEILDGVVQVGRATGTERRAKDLVASLRDRIEAVRATAARLPGVRTFCLEWLAPPYAGGHWVPEMVEIAGGEHLLNPPGSRSRVVTWREVANALPDVLVFMPCGYYLSEAEEEASRIYRVPEFGETAASSAGAVYAVDATSYFSRPGPRVVDGLEILAWAMHPDAFPEPEPGRISRIAPPSSRR
jgi:iron complex transport system substrate-binding protein